MRVRWTTEAKKSFNKVIDFMYLQWPEKEVAKFVDRTDEIVANFLQEPYLFKAYEDDPRIRHGILHKNITLFYRAVSYTHLTLPTKRIV